MFFSVGLMYLLVHYVTCWGINKYFCSSKLHGNSWSCGDTRPSFCLIFCFNLTTLTLFFFFGGFAHLLLISNGKCMTKATSVKIVFNQLKLFGVRVLEKCIWMCKHYVVLTFISWHSNADEAASVVATVRSRRVDDFRCTKYQCKLTGQY